ncbi:MAG: lysyl oxidase family protein, partial [Nocardioides sp.]
MLENFGSTGHTHRSRTTRLAAALVAAALTLLAVVASAPAPAQAAERGLRLVSTNDTVHAYGDGTVVYVEPAAFLAAYGQGYEFWAKRDRYADPVTMTKTVLRGRSRTTTPVPSKLVDGFNGFKNGLTTTVKNAAGTVLMTDRQSLCPAGWDS